MELWDIYDINRINTGKTLERGSRFEPGSYHLVVHICIFNSKGEMLIQQRQPFKEGWPNKWDITVGGSAVSGESSQMAAERELVEEIGYKVDLKNVRPHFSINFKVGFDDFYLIVDDLDISKLHLQYDEVQQVKWASKDEILRLLSTNEFIPYYKSLIEMCFEMIQGYGAHKF
ncbi:MAG: hydrolase [Bacillales bacterium]|nr:hydrolase [Bacillales bacterium]